MPPNRPLRALQKLHQQLYHRSALPLSWPAGCQAPLRAASRQRSPRSDPCDHHLQDCTRQLHRSFLNVMCRSNHCQRTSQRPSHTIFRQRTTFQPSWKHPRSPLRMTTSIRTRSKSSCTQPTSQPQWLWPESTLRPHRERSRLYLPTKHSPSAHHKTLRRRLRATALWTRQISDD